MVVDTFCGEGPLCPKCPLACPGAQGSLKSVE